MACEHCGGEGRIIIASPTRYDPVAETDRGPCDECGGTGATWEEQFRAENVKRLRLETLVFTLLHNDPTDDAADGVSVLDVWRKDASEALYGTPKPPQPRNEEEIAF